MERPVFSATRDRLGSRLAELARLLKDPRNVDLVRGELERLGQGLNAMEHNHGGFRSRHDLTRDRQLFPSLELTPDLTRGEQRFAVEVAIAEMIGSEVPAFAHNRAFEALTVMARG
jgi:hypothetical protein